MADKTKKQILLEAQEESNLILAAKRIEVLKALIELTDMNADDDYKITIMEVLKAFGGSLSLAFMAEVLTDSNKFLAARKVLREATDAGPAVIVETKDKDEKTKIILTLIKDQ
jgi:hypothetical protein